MSPRQRAAARGIARAWSARLLRVGMGLVAGLLLLEGALQLGARIAAPEDRSQHSPWRPGHLRVIAVGDSNTWGLRVDRAEAYPSQLEALLNRQGEQPIQLVNLGVPGADSTRLGPGFPHLLERYAPDWVLLLIGSNDFWLPPARPAERAGAASLRDTLAEHSRAYKLLFVALRARQGQTAEGGAARPLFGGAQGRQASPDRIRSFRSLRRQLGAMVREARTRGIRLLILTYPSPLPSYAAASEALRQVARESQTPLVDLGAAFSHASGNPSRLFFPDGHPRAAGYRRMAQRVAARFARLREADGDRGPTRIRRPSPR